MKNDKPYKVVYSGMVRKRLENFARIAENVGILDAFLTSLKTIDQRLQHDPDVFGESKYTLQSLDLEMRHVAVMPLAVLYGLHLQRHLVIISDFRLMG